VVSRPTAPKSVTRDGLPSITVTVTSQMISGLYRETKYSDWNQRLCIVSIPFAFEPLAVLCDCSFGHKDTD